MSRLSDFFSSGVMAKVMRVISAFEVLQESEEYKEFVAALEALND